MSVNASTYAYALNEKAATNSHASTGAPVTGSAKLIGSPAQSTSMDSPGSRGTRIDAPVDVTQRRYCSLKNEYRYGTPPAARQAATYSFHSGSSVTDGRASSRCTSSKSGATRPDAAFTGSGSSWWRTSSAPRSATCPKPMPAAFAAVNTAATVFREQPSTSAIPRWLTPSARSRRIRL